MIPATQPYEANFRHGEKGSFSFTTKPVIAWDDEGRALVVSDQTHRLVQAESYRNFHGVSEAGGPVVAAIPGGGWSAVYRQDDGSQAADPVLTWLVRVDGTVTPIDTDGQGVSEEPAQSGNFVQLLPPSVDLPTES